MKDLSSWQQRLIELQNQKSDKDIINLKKQNNMETKYFDIHVDEGGGQGYSVAIKIEEGTETMTEKLGTNDNEIINEAVRQGRLDADDRKYVDNVSEITLADFIDMTDGINA